MGIRLLTCLICLGVCLPLHAGEIAGAILIVKPLTRKKVTVNAYQFRGVSAKPLASESSISEMERVVVYLDGSNLDMPQPGAAILNQKNQRFDPEILVVPSGSTVSFPNNDPFFHNVFSLSRIKSFDLGYYPAGRSRSVEFRRPGVVQVFCHLHPQMSAAIVVSPTGHFTRPDSAGQFRFEGVRPGPVKLVVWHKSAGYFHRSLEAPSEGRIRVDVTIPLQEEETSDAVTVVR